MSESTIQNVQTFKVKKDQGITQVLKEHISKMPNSILSDGKITNAEWDATIDVLIDINNSRAKGEKLFRGGIDKSGEDWHSNFIVYKDQELAFTKEEMDRLYKAMGVTLQKEQPSDKAEAAKEATKPAAAAQKTDSVAVAQKTDAAATQTKKAEEKPEKNSKLRKGLLIGGAALLGAGIAAVAVAVASKGKRVRGIENLLEKLHVNISGVDDAIEASNLGKTFRKGTDTVNKNNTAYREYGVLGNRKRTYVLNPDGTHDETRVYKLNGKKIDHVKQYFKRLDGGWDSYIV